MKLLNKIKGNGLLKSSILLFVATSLMNFLAYLFHFYAGRNLGPADYGVLVSLLSFVYIIVVPLNSVQTSITKFVAEFFANKEHDKIFYLYRKSLFKFILAGFVLFIIFSLFIPLISSFLKIEQKLPMFVLAIYAIMILIFPITRGILQGLQNFKGLSLTYILEGITKFGFGVLFVSYFIKGVTGAMVGFISSAIIPLIVSFYLLRKWWKKGVQKFDTKPIYKYSFPVLLAMISMTLYYSIDVMLVKHFFDAIDAGHYGALSLIAKIIFFGSIAVSLVMFPKVSELYAKGKSSNKILKLSLLMIFLLGFFANIIYFFFPGFVVGLLFGQEYLVIKPLVGLFGLVMTFYSLGYILVLYNLAINRFKILYPLILFNILQIGVIWIWHKDLAQVVYIMLMLMFILFLVLSIFTFLKKNETIINNTSEE